MRVCVIGSGVMGASIAFRLAQHHGVEVDLVDGRQPGSGTTAVSFAWVNAGYKRPHAYFDLNHAGMREYRRLENELRRAPWLHPGGCLTTRDHAADISEAVDLVRSWGYDADLLDARTVNRLLEPAVDFGDPDLPIAYFPEEFCVDAVALTEALVGHAAENGAHCYFGTEVAEVASRGDGFAVRLSDGCRLNVDTVVNAAGAKADRVGALLGAPIPLAPTSGVCALVRAPGHPVGRVIHTGGIDLRPEGDDLLRLHHTPVDDLLTRGESDPAELADRLFRAAVEVVPRLRDAQVVKSVVGVRPIPSDGVSSLGAVPGTPGYYEAVTHSGVTLGPLFGRLLAEEIVSGKVDPLVESFRPDRFTRD